MSDIAFLPRERDVSPIRRPRWVFRVAALGHHGMHARTIRLHDVDLLRPAAIGHKRDLATVCGIPGRRYVYDLAIDRQSPRITTVPIGDIDLHVAGFDS